MYRKKLNPQESLDAILLRMKYDSKKTLNENLEMTEASLPRTDPDYKIASEIWNGVGGAGTKGALGRYSNVTAVPSVNKIAIAAGNPNQRI